jgi:AcrR family transcriptional regulator
VGYFLNLFKTSKAAATRARLLQTALALFRSRGFERTTLRDISRAARMSLGAAYYYFPSKEAIVAAYYDEVQEEHARRFAAALPSAPDLEARLATALRTKLLVLRGDKKVLGALFRFAGEARHPLSPFGARTRGQREQAMAIFARALGDDVPPALRALAPRLLWAAHLALLLYFLHDRSPASERTFALADRAAALAARGLTLASLPGAAALVAQAMELFDPETGAVSKEEAS